MRYQAARRYLREREQFHVKVGLRNIQQLVAALGNPQHRVPAVRVAGTNGKGSTVALLDAILRASGLRVGRFTSPHLVDIEERIVIDGVRITESEFAELVGAVAEASADFPEGHQPSFFESVTAVGLLAFQRHRVEVGVFEVGMGGRWDATGVVDTHASLVTRIALDHERFLGSTVTAIAGEKGATAAAGRPLLVARQEPDALSALAQCARSRNARFHPVAQETEADFRVERTGSTGTLRTLARTYPDLTLPLPGRHQLENLALAVRGAEAALEELGRPAPEPDRVRRGVAGAAWPGRLQWIPGEPRLLLDAAHNPDGARRLAEFLAQWPRDRDRVLVFGTMRDKKCEAMLAPLLPHFDRVVLTRAGSRRALDQRELAARVEAATGLGGVPTETAGSVEAALARARATAGAGGEIVVAGSIHLLGEALAGIEAEGPEVFDATELESVEVGP